MATGLDTERLRLAFETRPDLVAGIEKAADSPARVALFNSIAGFVCARLQGDDEPAVKRRRVQDDAAAASSTRTNGLASRGAAVASGAAGLAAAAAAETVELEIKDMSLSMPQRKKLDLCFTKNYLYARAAQTTAPVQGIVYAWTDIEHVFCLPVPDKAQVQHSYVLLPRGQALASLCKTPPATATTPATDGLPEPLVLAVSAAAPKPGAVSGPAAGEAAAVADSYRTLLHWALERRLTTTRIVGTDARLFHSMARQAYRPSEQAVHVRAFRGSKDGFLFFLPTGILWAFKKPLLFMALDRIAAVSYTNVLQRTFNVVVEVDVGGGRAEEVEFGMLDQEDYGSIDETYVRRHGLQDRSMAERRKAKRELAENAKEGGGDDEDEGEGEGEGENENENENENGGVDGTPAQPKTEQELQDEEDEMEEDYDPGSDDDSGGSGSSDGSDEEDQDMEDEEDDEEDVVGKAEE